MNQIIKAAMTVGLILSAVSSAEQAEGSLDRARAEIELAEKAEKESYIQALNHYQKALDMVEKIINDPAKADLAEKIRSGEQKIGPYTYQQLKGEIIPKQKRKAEAESDPLACSFFIISNVYKNPYSISRDSMELALAYFRVGEKEMSKKILPFALNTAKNLDDERFRNHEIWDIAEAYLTIGMPNKAKEVAELISDEKIKVKIIDEIENYRVSSPDKKEDEERPKIIGWWGSADEDSKKQLEIVLSNIEMGEIEKALETAQKMKKGFEKTRAFAEIGEEYLKQNKAEEAKKIYLLIAHSLGQSSNYFDPLFSLGSVAHSYASYGGTDSEVYIWLLSYAGKIESEGAISAEIYPVIEIVHAYTSVQGKDRKVFLKMLETASVIYCEYRKSGALREIGVAYHKAGLKPGEEERKILHQIIAQYENKK